MVTPLMTPHHDAWDVVVIGAGPAGTVAARETARQGARTLLLERSAFPRYKVCGGCLSADGVAALRAAGLGDLLQEVRESPITALHLASPNARTRLDLRGGIVIRRDRFDRALAVAAVEAGVTFLDRTNVHRIEAGRTSRWRLHVRHEGTEHALSSTSVIVAAGLACDRILPPDCVSSQVRARSKFGVGAFVSAYPDHEHGAIEMAVGRLGYVGTVRAGAGLIVAAALDVQAARAQGGPASCLHALRAQAGFSPLSTLDALAGTPKLTRRRAPVAMPGLFLIGDSAGYVEPFTGEGMTWAVESALAAAPLAARAALDAQDKLARRYRTWHRTTLRPRMRRCAMMSRALAAPTLAVRAATGLRALPGPARHFRQGHPA